MIKDTPTFAHYGKSFQEKLRRLVLDDRQFADQIGEVIDVGFFETKYLQVFNKKVFDYKEKYGTHPTRSILETILRTDLDEENDLVKQQVREFFARAQTAGGAVAIHDCLNVFSYLKF